MKPLTYKVEKNTLKWKQKVFKTRVQPRLLEQEKYWVSENAMNIYDSESLRKTLKTFQKSLT